MDTVAEWLRRGPAIAYKLVRSACASSNLVGVENFFDTSSQGLRILLFNGLLRLEMNNTPFEHVD
jgi:hypothetical protein